LTKAALQQLPECVRCMQKVQASPPPQLPATLSLQPCFTGHTSHRTLQAGLPNGLPAHLNGGLQPLGCSHQQLRALAIRRHTALCLQARAPSGAASSRQRQGATWCAALLHCHRFRSRAAPACMPQLLIACPACPFHRTLHAPCADAQPPAVHHSPVLSPPPQGQPLSPSHPNQPPTRAHPCPPLRPEPPAPESRR